MAVNRYDNPAQAQFIDTYVPIPFEQLYTLGKQANERVDKALADYRTAANTWADFQSQSMKDMQTDQLQLYLSKPFLLLLYKLVAQKYL
jgi:hypothetical protein